MKTNLFFTARIAFTIVIVFFTTFFAKAQTAAPYALSPKWVFGNRGMFDFTGGGTPTQPSRTDNIVASEGSSTLCDSSKNVAIYDNNVRIAGNNMTPLGTSMVNSSSSTQGGVIIPNPSNPYGQFYIITGNSEAKYEFLEPDDSPKEGLKVYRSNKSGTTTVTAPVLASTLDTDPNVKENVYVSSDGNYGYWIISGKISGAGATTYSAWPVPAATGTIGARVTSAGATGIWNEQYQGSVKVNRCQTLIAFVQGSAIQIYEWDRTTGRTGAVKVSYINPSPSSKYYGCEFSPNGNYLFVTTLDASPLSRVNVTTGAVSTPFGANASGSLQLAPNNVIYIANGLDGSPNTNVGTITNPDAGGTYTAAGISLINSSNVRLGISNIAWINPRKPKIKATLNSCGNYTFTPEFLTYFKDAININKAVWNFGDATGTTNTGSNSYNPVSHTYTTNGSKTVTLTVTDATCTQDWIGTLSFNVPCSLPVTLISFAATADRPSHTVSVNWTTATEINNDYFEVQRSSDGINFTTIGIVKGNGNSQQIIDYNFLDLQPGNGVQYYRLIQHDYDGKSETTEIVSVNMNEAVISIVPNPSLDEFTLSVNAAGEATLTVYTMLGSEIFKAEIPAATSSFNFGKDFSAGAYVVRYTSATESKAFKLEKK